ncbi:putative nucleoside-diphosphate sugar epimerase [Cryptosporangium arvum DSM 44712]|uniref:Putative nucleoside-diphosphate sugar epimerase n=1 Tax=Cryptosporangium arvum DSM 44712 TaxID=927661 RepID=A0A010Z3U4_9ACTN|nr:putative nucleoside-diphosphate sugar epimerase [Cryptosporangium arvum DSM 44712]
MVTAALETGVDTTTGEGVADAVAGADVVIDVTNRAVFDPEVVMDFFTTSTHTLLDAERQAGVRHHVVLSIVGVDRLSYPGYLDAKKAQERLVADSGVPFTTVRSTQFFENLTAMGTGAAQGGVIVLPTADLQPIAAADVATTVADVATSAPLNSVVEIAGPERGAFTRLIAPVLAAHGDHRPVRSDAAAGYFGVPIVPDSLVPLGPARLGRTTFEDWSTTTLETT